MTHRWADEMGAELAGMWLAGEGIGALADRLAERGHIVLESTVRRWLARHGHVRGVPDDGAGAEAGPAVVGGKRATGVCHAHQDLIRQMAPLGHSAAEIARKVSEVAGVVVSRNAVISFCWRNEVSLAAGRAQRNGAAMMPAAEQKGSGGFFRMGHGKLSDYKLPNLRPRKAADVATAATIITRRRDGCAFLGGGHEPATHATPCCNAPVVPGTSWCAAHAAIVFAGRGVAA
jgi:hypothetical protein